MSAADEEQRLWSVTTLIKSGLPKEALVWWAAKVTAERAYDDFKILVAYANEGKREEGIKWLTDARWQTAKKAAARGTLLHQAAEQYALGRVPEVEPHVVPWVEQYQRFLREHAPVFLAAEAPVYNLTEHYAGTMDGIVRIQGKTVLLDIKTHAKDDDAKSKPPYPDIALQLVAYARAERIGVDPAQQRNYNGRRYYIWTPQAAWTPMPELDGAVCLAISPTDYELVPVAIDDEVWNAFLSVRAVARWALQTSQRVLGPPLAPSVEIESGQGLPLTAAPTTGQEPTSPDPESTAGLDNPSFVGEEPPPYDGQQPEESDPRTDGEREMEEFIQEADQRGTSDAELWERVHAFLTSSEKPANLTELSKGCKTQTTRLRPLLERAAQSGALINKGTEGRPRYALKEEA